LVKDTLTTSTKNAFSSVKKFVADSIAGTYTYRVVAKDASGVYVGSGGDLVVTVSADFNYISYRFLYVPDSTAKTNKCYFATATGKTYSYTDGAANSASIDFGYFYDTTGTAANAPLGHTIYALNASTFAPYDLSSWTKNATVFKKATTPTFANLTSAGALKSAAVTNLTSGTTSKINGLASGNLVFFKTAAGKAGCAQINFVSGSNASSSTYINIDVRIQN